MELSLSGLSILVLEDEPMLRKQIAAHLERLGADVSQASTLGVAEKLATDLNFDFAFLDINLPDGLGTDLLMRQWPVERRSGRLDLAVPVFVYGWSTADDSPFTEITRTLEVSAHGGLVALHAMVQPHQAILIVNRRTETERKCRVVRVDRKPDNACEVGFEFIRPEGRF